MGTPKRDGGFSLLEVLVAFAITAIALGVILQIVSTGLRSAALSEDYTHAAVLAESKLSLVGVEIPLQEGVSEGEFDDRYRWKTVVEPYNSEIEDEQLEDHPRVLLFRVAVEVIWQDGSRERRFRLDTLRSARKTG